ncbi:sigma-70 family RNA polymerase sigma factor [Bradyrhizobium sp. Ai1a-2]|uniref:RNA polymerase sigma factor n=1 Tax=Bradyrhizobium sp. Ai1a-2 TaxID=196490 RepID=UPI00040DA741|nr:sigma-70 family RNA polymerase sigma factor [Bradyrhizobium sp. Ai1a-2]
MSETTLGALRQLLVDRYDEIKAKLAQRVGSTDLAADALQDTWLRLTLAETLGPVRSLESYLFRTVFNMAQERRRSERRLLSAVEIQKLLFLIDEAPDPAQAAEARSELEALETILSELPPRRRLILLMARMDGMPRQEIADRLAISLRLVSKELNLAHEYCVLRRSQMKD